MIKNQAIFMRALRWVSTLAILVACPLSYAQDPVTVKALAVHSGSNIQYSYQVSNHTSARNIVTVNIGDSGKLAPPVTRGNSKPELSLFPLGSYWGPPNEFGDQRYMEPRLGGVFISPPGWNAQIMLYEQTSNFSINWRIDENITSNFPVIYPGQTFNFSVTTPIRGSEPFENYSPLGELAYLKAHFTVGFDDNEKTGDYTGSIVPIDTTPPTLLITLRPNILWPPNNKMVSVNAAITVKDDYDPEPEIKLESITASEALAANDIQDAQLGTDDRQFSLAAEREGTNLAGRIYTVTYSATDASGNKTTASTTAIVPHDQGQ